MIGQKVRSVLLGTRACPLTREKRRFGDCHLPKCGVIVFVLIFLASWIKLRMEKQWMRSQFGETYAT
jgi:hypothetical protein